MLGRDQPEIGGHQLPRIGKTLKVADLGDHGHRDHQRDAAHRLHGGDHRRHRPAWEQFLLNLAGQPSEPGFRIGNRVDVILLHDLLCRMGKPHRGQP